MCYYIQYIFKYTCVLGHSTLRYKNRHTGLQCPTHGTATCSTRWPGILFILKYIASTTEKVRRSWLGNRLVGFAGWFLKNASIHGSDPGSRECPHKLNIISIIDHLNILALTFKTFKNVHLQSITQLPQQVTQRIWRALWRSKECSGKNLLCRRRLAQQRLLRRLHYRMPLVVKGCQVKIKNKKTNSRRFILWLL